MLVEIFFMEYCDTDNGQNGKSKYMVFKILSDSCRKPN